MKYLSLILLLLLLAGCATLPEGNYVGYQGTAGSGSEIIATGEYGNYHVDVLSGPPVLPTYTHYPTYTPGLPEPTIDSATQPPTQPPLPKCDIRAGPGIPYYAQPSTAGGALGLLGEGITYQPKTILSTNNNIWAYIVGKGYVPDMAGFRIFDNEACRDLLQPAVTPVPTSSVPTPTPIGKIYACTNGQDFLNVRSSTSTASTANIVGRLLPGQKLEIVTKLDTRWWEVRWNGQPGYYLAGWLAREC